MNFKKRVKLFLSSVADRASYRVFVANNSANRKVLIVADEAAIKNLLALVRKLDNRRAVAANIGLGLSTINRKSFDTAILDLRCSGQQPGGRGFGFGEVFPSIVGRVLVIIAEVNNLKTFGLVERYIHRRHFAEGLLFNLGSFARSLVSHSPSPNHI